jgi:hypothetical protein
MKVLRRIFRPKRETANNEMQEKVIQGGACTSEQILFGLSNGMRAQGMLRT